MKPARRRRAAARHHDVRDSGADHQARDPQRLVRPIETTMSTTMFIAARPVGIQGRWSAKKVRVSSRLSPPKGRLTANQNSAIEIRCVECGVEVPVLVDQPHDRCASTIRNAAAGISSRLIWRMPIASARRIASRRGAPPAAERREQHGRDGDAEHALRQHVDAERVVDRARRSGVDERPEDRVDQLVEVDDPQADRDRQHQHEDLAARAGRASRAGSCRRKSICSAPPPPSAAGRRSPRGSRSRRRRCRRWRREVRPQHDHADDDHDVPDRRRDRRDAKWS